MTKKQSQTIEQALDQFASVLPQSDGMKTAEALRALIKTAHEEGWSVSDIFELIQETGLSGRENLKHFIEKEFDAVST